MIEEAHVLLYLNTTNRSMRSICTLSRVKHSESSVRAIHVSVRIMFPYIPATLLATAQNMGNVLLRSETMVTLMTVGVEYA